MTYPVEFGELGRRMADNVHDILDGAKPGDVPIYLPTKYEFPINLKVAYEVGLTIPPILLATAGGHQMSGQRAAGSRESAGYELYIIGG